MLNTDSIRIISFIIIKNPNYSLPRRPWPRQPAGAAAPGGSEPPVPVGVHPRLPRRYELRRARRRAEPAQLGRRRVRTARLES